MPVKRKRVAAATQTAAVETAPASAAPAAPTQKRQRRQQPTAAAAAAIAGTSSAAKGTNPYASQIDEWITDASIRAAIRAVQPACVFVDSADELGSGVCLAPDGLILTAGHASGAVGSERTIEFVDGRKRTATCIDVAAKWDLGLLQIQPQSNATTAAAATADTKSDSKSVASANDSFPIAALSTCSVGRRDTVVVIGQPGDNGRSPRQRLSVGTVQRVPKPAAVLNEQLAMGGIIHNCWTYAGHSGSPVFNRSGGVCGIHVTADHFEGAAITLEAIRAFVGSRLTAASNSTATAASAVVASK